MGVVKEMKGLRFGRWTVLEFSGLRKSNSRAMWLCRCDCGVERVVDGTHLRRHKTVSCGCYREDTVSAYNMKHGMASDPVYRLWARIKNRCYNNRSDDFKFWGGRGISAHEEWVNDPAVFIAWIKENLGECPEGHSLDRIDNDGNYEPGNLRWATAKEQNNNRRPRGKNYEALVTRL